MEWTEKEEGEWTVLKLIGVINIDSVEELKSLFTDLLAKGVLNVRLNLKNVPISNSSGIGHILMLFKSLIFQCRSPIYNARFGPTQKYRNIFQAYERVVLW